MLAPFQVRYEKRWVQIQLGCMVESKLKSLAVSVVKFRNHRQQALQDDLPVKDLNGIGNQAQNQRIGEQGAFEMVDGKSQPVNAEECLGCESCIEVCEPNAITIEET